MILLDSDVLIDLLEKKSNKSQLIMQKISNSKETDIRISAIALEEVLFGLIKRTNVTNFATLPLLQFPVLDFGRNEAIEAAQIEVQMEKMGKKKLRGDEQHILLAMFYYLFFSFFANLKIFAYYYPN